jgi:hypothetical protein
MEFGMPRFQVKLKFVFGRLVLIFYKQGAA